MLKTLTFNVQGMHCASCAINIEHELKKAPGVSAAEVNYGTETAKVSFEPAVTGPDKLAKAIKPLGYTLINSEAAAMGMSENEHEAHLGLKQSKQAKLAELDRMRVKLLLVLPITLFSIVAMVWNVLLQLNIVSQPPALWLAAVAWLSPLLASYMLFVVGWPYLQGVWRFIRFGHANMDTLIGLGTAVAYAYSVVVSLFAAQLSWFIDTTYNYYDVTIVVIAFITLGKYLEARAKLKTGDAIEKLLNLQAKTALVLKDGREVELPISELKHGDLVVVKPAGRVPVDGILTEGSSYIDEALVTGESMPVAKKAGDNVVAGTLNTTGAFTFSATKVGSETLLAQIIKMVQQAQSSKAPIQALADKISGVFVPIVLALAFVTLGLWLALGSQFLGFSRALSFGLTSFVGILVIACPCALGLATPTAIIVGVGKGARAGILVKDAATLEKLHKANVVVLDKTGTLTKGKPELASLQNFSEHSDERLLAVLAALESKSEHPIAAAILEHVKSKNIKPLTVENFVALKGQGVKGQVEKNEYYVGNSTLLNELGLKFDPSIVEKYTRIGQTPLLLATAGKVLGLFMVADTLKPEARAAITQLHKLKLKVLMLSGDDKNTAEYIARQLGIDEVIAQVKPADKLVKVKELQQTGQVVAMVGDGVNDAPALAQADVGIAMATGTDVAIESAGITLLHGDIAKLVKAIRLSKLTMRGIKQNLFWAFIYNIIGIPLAGGLFYPLFGWLLSPIFAGLAMAFSSVSVVANSLRLKAKKL